MQVELTDEKIRQMIDAGTWKLPESATTLPVQEREKELQEITNYIEEVRRGDKSYGGATFRLLGTAGMTGIGKTQLLLNGLKRAKELTNVKAAYFTFNGQGGLKASFLDHLTKGAQYGDAFGRTLLAACSVKDEAKALNLKEGIKILRKLMDAGNNEHIVLFIDDLGFLDENLQEGVRPPVVPLLKDFMQFMDPLENKAIFIFSHLLEEMLAGVTEGSGRPLQCLSLRALQIDTWKRGDRFQRWREAAAQWSGVHQLLLLCAGHPRSLFDGLDRVAKEQPEVLKLNEAPTPVALYRARATITNVCKFDSMLDDLMEDSTVSKWFNLLGERNLRALRNQGLLVEVNIGGEDLEEEAFFHPLVLCEWARRCQKRSRLALHLQKAYEYDAQLGEGSEKRMEGLMYHYEAVLRIALDGKPICLKEFYKTDFIGDQFKYMSLVAALPEGTSSLVEFVKDFSDMKHVTGLLKKGITVVSTKQVEVGVEYLTPWRQDTADGELVVAFVQCKFVQRKADWKTIKDRMGTAVERFKDEQIQVVPVVYATPDQYTIDSKTYQDGVYFTEKSLFEFTRKLGILRLHTEKLGKSLEEHVPVLSRSRSKLANSTETAVSPKVHV